MAFLTKTPEVTRLAEALHDLGYGPKKGTLARQAFDNLLDSGVSFDTVIDGANGHRLAVYFLDLQLNNGWNGLLGSSDNKVMQSLAEIVIIRDGKEDALISIEGGQGTTTLHKDESVTTWEQEIGQHLFGKSEDFTEKEQDKIDLVFDKHAKTGSAVLDEVIALIEAV